MAAFDAEHIWHPYAPLPGPQAALPVREADGVRLRLGDGRELIDGMASWWCAVHGYRNAALDAALLAQSRRMSHVMFGGLTHAPAVQVAEALLAIVPAGLDRIFFCDSGSVAVEVAMKMALQAMQGRGEGRRRRFLSLRGAYHGDTFGAMSLCDPVNGMHGMFAGALSEQFFAPQPPGGFRAPLAASWVAAVEQIFAASGEQIAAVVMEPVVQGAGGMHIYSPEYLACMRRLCDQHGVLLILDEIATGFGRSGALFAAEHASIAPDIMCVGKALTGGYVSMAATLCTGAVAAAVCGGESGALMHGPTYMANPLACAVASASLGIIGEGRWRQQCAAIEAQFEARLGDARRLGHVIDVRALGAIGVIQCRRPVDLAAAGAAAVKHGVWLRPFRDLIYAMPPYIIGQPDLETLCDAMIAAAEAA